jgi:hypothetical protein
MASIPRTKLRCVDAGIDRATTADCPKRESQAKVLAAWRRNLHLRCNPNPGKQLHAASAAYIRCLRQA